MRMAKGGQLRGRVTEDQLIGVLDQVEAAEKGRTGGGAGGGGGAGKIVVRTPLPPPPTRYRSSRAGVVGRNILKVPPC